MRYTKSSLLVLLPCQALSHLVVVQGSWLGGRRMDSAECSVQPGIQELLRLVQMTRRSWVPLLTIPQLGQGWHLSRWGPSPSLSSSSSAYSCESLMVADFHLLLWIQGIHLVQKDQKADRAGPSCNRSLRKCLALGFPCNLNAPLLDPSAPRSLRALWLFLWCAFAKYLNPPCSTVSRLLHPSYPRCWSRYPLRLEDHQTPHHPRPLPLQ